jgi:hypothetical protein
LLEADFPPFLGGGGTDPIMAYCFWGDVLLQGHLRHAGGDGRGHPPSLQISLSFPLTSARLLGSATFPLSSFDFRVDVETDASDDEVQRVKSLADERCPAIWAMQNPVAYSTTARKL